MERLFMCLVVQVGNAKIVHAIGPKIFQLLNCLMIDLLDQRFYDCVPNTRNMVYKKCPQFVESYK